MTLILTEVCVLGVAMAADSAVTSCLRLPNREPIIQVLTGVQKLQYIPKINAGISCWGLGEINQVPLDIWLKEFINDRREEYDSLENFAHLLQNILREELGSLVDPPDEDISYGTIGFHLAGIEEFNGQPTAHFFHIHNGESEALRLRGQSINPHTINANHDFTPERFQRLQRGMSYRTRNGDIRMYAELSKRLQDFFNEMAKTMGVRIPTVRHISEISEWLKFQIQLIADLYEFSNLQNTIGGNIDTLWIGLDGSNHLSRR